MIDTNEIREAAAKHLGIDMADVVAVEVQGDTARAFCTVGDGKPAVRVHLARFWRVVGEEA